MVQKYKNALVIAIGCNSHQQHALKGRVFKIRLKFGTFFSRIIGLTN